MHSSHFIDRNNAVSHKNQRYKSSLKIYIQVTLHGMNMLCLEICVYKCAYMNSIITDEEAMNLKKSMEEYMELFRIKKGNGKYCNSIKISKIK